MTVRLTEAQRVLADGATRAIGEPDRCRGCREKWTRKLAGRPCCRDIHGDDPTGVAPIVPRTLVGGATEAVA